MNQERSQSITQVVHRGHDENWLEKAEENRLRQRRRKLSIAAIILVIVLVIAFLLDDGPRRSGMLDALGVTCGEFVGSPTEDNGQVFEPWDEHAATLSDSIQQRPEDQGEFDASNFSADVEALAAERDAEPVSALFTGWTNSDQTVSAAAIGDTLVVGHHEHTWTMTDRVSVVDPETGVAEWTVPVEHPQWEDWQPPERALYGVGTAEDRLLLQTPAVNGDTDVVILSGQDGTDQDCIRLEGDVDPVEALQDGPAAWPVTIDLNASRLSEDEFMLLHGLTEDSGGHMVASEVNIDSHEVAGTAEFDDYPPQSAAAESEADSMEVATDLRDVEIEELKPLGENHYLLTWEAGVIILQQS